MSSLRHACLALALLVPACANQTLGTDGPSDTGLDAEEDAALFDINAERAAAGITTPLVVCTALNVAAAQHSDDMRTKDYLSDTGLDGTGVRERTCAAGYTTSCTGSASLAEMVANGLETGDQVVAKWKTDAANVNAWGATSFVAVGCGRSIADDGTMYWTVVLGSTNDASCQ
jgi:uncharacterized protein YkwD